MVSKDSVRPSLSSFTFDALTPFPTFLFTYVQWIIGYIQNPIISLLINTSGKLTGNYLAWQPLSPTLPLRWDKKLPISMLLTRIFPGKKLGGATLRIQESWIIMPPLWYFFLVPPISAWRVLQPF